MLLHIIHSIVKRQKKKKTPASQFINIHLKRNENNSMKFLTHYSRKSS